MWLSWKIFIFALKTKCALQAPCIYYEQGTLHYDLKVMYLLKLLYSENEA